MAESMIPRRIIFYQNMIIIFIILTQTAPQDSLLKFADYLYENKEYEQAIGEYRRYLFVVDSIDTAYVRKRIIEGLIKIEKYGGALKEARRFSNIDLQRTYLGKIYYYTNQLDSCQYYLEQVEDTPCFSEAKKFLGLGLAKSFNFSKASNYLVLPERRLKKRSSVLAGFLSIIPGLGQIYAGRWGDGLYSLSLISIGGAASYYYYSKDEDIKFSIAAAVTSIFYIANIYGAVVAGHNYNFYQNYSYFTEIEATVLESR